MCELSDYAMCLAFICCKQVWMLRKVPKTSECSLVMSQ